MICLVDPTTCWLMSRLMDSGANYLIVEGGTFKGNTNKPLSIWSFSEGAIKIKFRWRVSTSCFRPKTYFLNGNALANLPKVTSLTSLTSLRVNRHPRSNSFEGFGENRQKQNEECGTEKNNPIWHKTLDNVELLCTSLRQDSTNCPTV